MEARTRVLGPDHPDTLGTANNLADTLREQGDLAGARAEHGPAPVPENRPYVRVEVEVREEYANLTDLQVTVTNAGTVPALAIAANHHRFSSGEHRWWSSPEFDLPPGSTRTFRDAHAEAGSGGQRYRRLTDGIPVDCTAVTYQDVAGNHCLTVHSLGRTTTSISPAGEASPPERVERNWMEESCRSLSHHIRCGTARPILIRLQQPADSPVLRASSPADTSASAGRISRSNRLMSAGHRFSSCHCLACRIRSASTSPAGQGRSPPQAARPFGTAPQARGRRQALRTAPRQMSAGRVRRPRGHAGTRASWNPRSPIPSVAS